MNQCIVRQLSSLKTLTKDELVRISDHKTMYSIAKGEVIFTEGQRIDGIYCVKDGVCKMTKLSANGNDQIVKLMTKGELLGQRSLISDEPANLTATAIADMQVCFIPKREILNVFATNSQFAINYTKRICEDLKQADDELVNLAQFNARQGLAQLLVYLAETFGTDHINLLNIRLSREEMASMIGTATENCIRMLSDFAKSGLIAIARKKIVLLDLPGLKKL